ncbi:hypothetical protein [Shimazuella kribbensis]|uniref:hypothetical protein n=1 Tax=Shimazuella kribbensis TaxID=139808 RepID=UPI000405B216|nr:hypothetical protein [Shimazuella kribbensis]
MDGIPWLAAIFLLLIYGATMCMVGDWTVSSWFEWHVALQFMLVLGLVVAGAVLYSILFILVLINLGAASETKKNSAAKRYPDIGMILLAGVWGVCFVVMVISIYRLFI